MNKLDVKSSFASAVRAFRSRLDISQEELAGRAGLHRTYVSDIERGVRNLSLESIEKLARALEISVAALFSSVSHRLGSADGAQFSGVSGELVEILFVEDNRDDVELTLYAFQRMKISNQVQVVSDGAEAIDFLFRRGRYAQRQRSRQPQLILLDLNLPKIPGLEVLRRIKSDERTRTIPVVVLTASQRDRDIAESRRLGAENYIVKPVDFQRLSKVTPGLNLQWALMKPIEEARRITGHQRLNQARAA
jgi:CheY-like chemotaxis protein/DNA-binding Xre family transcriptional regulator